MVTLGLKVPKFWDMYEAPILIFLGLVALLLVYNAIVVRTAKAKPRGGFLMIFVPSALGQAYLEQNHSYCSPFEHFSGWIFLDEKSTWRSRLRHTSTVVLQ
jgi:hypothetical protein